MAQPAGWGYSAHGFAAAGQQSRRDCLLKFGSLQVFPRQGVFKEHGLDLPSAIVGRGEGSTILIDDFSVSRRHARLTVESGRLLVEDLGSVSGTLVDDVRLEPGVRHLVAEGAVLRFGEIEARYIAPATGESTLAPGAEAPIPAAQIALGGLHLALASPSLPIEAGKQATATLTVTNAGRLVDTIKVEVTDLPADWYTVDTPTLPLLPGGRAEIKLVLHPPRRHDSIAGNYAFNLVVRSREYDEHPEVTGEFDVLPFESVSLSLGAIRAKKHFRVLAENNGNDVVRYQLSGRDDEQAFKYEFETPAVELQPGQKRIISLKVDRRSQLFGTRQQVPFEVVGASASGAEVTARGQLAINPPLQRFKMPAMFTLAAAVLVVTGLAVMVITDGSGTQTAGAESRYEGVHLCKDDESDADAKSEQEERNEEASSDDSFAGATVVGPTSGGRPIFGVEDATGGPFFAQTDPRWGADEYARSTELPNGKDWCGTTIESCGCAMTSVSVMMALQGIVEMPDGSPLTPQTLNNWFNGNARETSSGWVSRGYIYGNVIWAAANELSGEIAKLKPGTRTVRFVRFGSGSEDEIRAELRAGRPIILEVPGHYIAAVGLDGDTILINDPYYREKRTLDAYEGNVLSSVLYEPSSDLSSVVLTAPSDVKFRVIDKQGRVVGTGTDGSGAVPAQNEIPGASVAKQEAWRDPTCIEKAPPIGAGTNQIVLPGSADDYRVEILDGGTGTGSVAIHTYARDGASTISTLEGDEGTTAELKYDPLKDAPEISILNNGTPVATETPEPGGSGGGEEEGTPTPETPTALPSPTATQTPFVEQRTAMTLPAEPGQTRVEVATNSGFELGDPIRFAPGLPNEEDNIIVGFGSFILATPLKFAHSPGEPIQRLPRPPGQGPGLPPGITPPPETGPIVPPSDLSIVCSTLYQASPKQATLICDAVVQGNYTNTRWTLNGQPVPDFNGSTSLLYAFTTETPASLALTVCNVTMCRSASKAEQIVFPTAGAGSGSSGTGAGSGGTPLPPPPPAGQVAVVCATEFPITPDGQLAQFSCTANFSGDYTSISWSAPGGQPANASGASKVFVTQIRNIPGAPQSLKVTATVCNFGVCFSSTPSEVGIGRTVTVLDSIPPNSPNDPPEVKHGQRLTLMATVQGTGATVAQGGTVQFYVDGNEIGESEPLFTQGNTAIAIGAVDTSDLTFAAPPGIQHVFTAVYSGGTNAFGSESDPRNLYLVPPIPDGCDSVNNDPSDDTATDENCELNLPRNLGAGTMLNDLSLNGQVGPDRNTIVVAPNEVFNVSGSAGRTDYCPGCIRQVYLAFGPNTTAGTLPQNQICVANGGFPLEPSGRTFSVQFQAPSRPGVYYLRATTTLDYFCVAPEMGPPETSVARVVVRQTVVPNVEIRNETGDAAVTGANEGDNVTLWATVPEGITGRVQFSATQPGINPGDPVQNLDLGSGMTENICPPSGEFVVQTPTGTQTIDCDPGVARLLTTDLPGLRGPMTVSARYQDPDPLELLDYASNTIEEVQIRLSPQAPPYSNPQPDPQLRVLTPGDVDIATVPNPVQMGADFTLTATVEAADPSLASAGVNGFGGTVQFMAGTNPVGAPVAVAPDGTASITWRAGVNPCVFPVAVCGGFPFDTKDDTDRSIYDDVHAVFTAGTSFLQDGQSGNTNVNIDPATSSAAITSVQSGPAAPTCSPDGGSPTIGNCLLIVATVGGTNGFDPVNGSVEFFADGDSLGTAIVGASGTATISVATGGSTDVIDDAGSYDITAEFGGTSALATSDSAAFPVSIGLVAPTVSVTTFPTGSVTAGDDVPVIVVTVSGPLPRISGGGATVQLLDSGAALTIPAGDISVSGAVWTFRVRNFDVDTYAISARYSGNQVYSEGFSSPEQTLTIIQANPAVTIDDTTSRAIGSTLPIQVDVAGSGATSPNGGTVTLYIGSTAGTNLGTQTVSGGSANFSLATGDGTNFPTATNYDLVARFNGTTNLSAVTSAVETQTVNKISAVVTLADVSVVRGNTFNLTATINSVAGVSADCISCVTFRLGTVDGAAIGTAVNVSGGTATLPSVSTGTGGVGEPFPSAGSYTVYAVYEGNANRNGDDDSGVVSVTLPIPTVDISGVSVVAGNGFTLTATVTPPGGQTVDCTACLGFRLGSTTGTLIGGSKVNVSGGTATLAQTAGSGSFPTGSSPFTVYAVYDASSVLATANDSATVTVSQASSSVAVTAGTVTVGSSITISATVSVAGSPSNPACDDCLRFYRDTITVGNRIGGLRDVAADGTVSFTLTTGSGLFSDPGTFTIVAVYEDGVNANANVAGSQGSAILTVTAIPVAMSISSTGTTFAWNVNVTISVVTAADLPGTVQIYQNGAAVGSAVDPDDGTITITWTTPNTAGNYDITVVYSTTNPDYQSPVTSNTLTITLTAPP